MSRRRKLNKIDFSIISDTKNFIPLFATAKNKGRAIADPALESSRCIFSPLSYLLYLSNKFPRTINGPSTISMKGSAESVLSVSIFIFHVPGVAFL